MNQLYIIGTITALLLGSTYYVYRLVSESRRKTPLDTKKLTEYEKTLGDIEVALNDDSQFLRYSKFSNLKDELEALKKQVTQLKNFFLKKKRAELLNKLDTVISDFPRLRERTNDRFIELERKRAGHIFTDSESRDLLTDEQLKAVLCNDNRNLIIAGAGSDLPPKNRRVC